MFLKEFLLRFKSLFQGCDTLFILINFLLQCLGIFLYFLHRFFWILVYSYANERRTTMNLSLWLFNFIQSEVLILYDRLCWLLHHFLDNIRTFLINRLRFLLILIILNLIHPLYLTRLFLIHSNCWLRHHLCLLYNRLIFLRSCLIFRLNFLLVLIFEILIDGLGLRQKTLESLSVVACVDFNALLRQDGFDGVEGVLYIGVVDVRGLGWVSAFVDWFLYKILCLRQLV